MQQQRTRHGQPGSPVGVQPALGGSHAAAAPTVSFSPPVQPLTATPPAQPAQPAVPPHASQQVTPPRPGQQAAAAASLPVSSATGAGQTWLCS